MNRSTLTGVIAGAVAAANVPPPQGEPQFWLVLLMLVSVAQFQVTPDPLPRVVVPVLRSGFFPPPSVQLGVSRCTLTSWPAPQPPLFVAMLKTS